ncbi:arginase family protein [Pantoea rodasii]|uniref:arginase family protein n=1 Tax=Pantoea rodasii TaxID=1076549 RepID=UPI000B071A6D|nr:arginase family protein [Pantoea rodasii]
MSGKNVEYTVFQGRAGDHNDLAMSGAKAIGEDLARRTGVNPVILGKPEQAINSGWREELDAALPALKEVLARLDDVLSSGAVSVAAISRCAVSLATLPSVARNHPNCCIVWFDSHADLNTPETTETGYLGGLALSGPAGLILLPDGRLETLVQDEKLMTPDALVIYDGWIYVPAPHIEYLADNNKGKDETRGPWTVYRFAFTP